MRQLVGPMGRVVLCGLVATASVRCEPSAGDATDSEGPPAAVCTDDDPSSEPPRQDEVVTSGATAIDFDAEYCAAEAAVDARDDLPWLVPDLPPEATSEYAISIESSLLDHGDGFDLAGTVSDSSSPQGYSVVYRVPQLDCDQLALYLLEVSVDDGQVDSADGLEGDHLFRAESRLGNGIVVREVLDPTGTEDCAVQTLDELVPRLDRPDGATHDLQREQVEGSFSPRD